MGKITAIRDLVVIGGIGAGAWLIWNWWNTKSIDTPGTQYTNYYVPSPDTYGTHEFHDTQLDSVYDGGWDYMGRLRGTTNDYFNMSGLDYWLSWTQGGII